MTGLNERPNVGAERRCRQTTGFTDGIAWRESVCEEIAEAKRQFSCIPGSQTEARAGVARGTLMRITEALTAASDATLMAVARLAHEALNDGRPAAGLLLALLDIKDLIDGRSHAA